MSGDAVGGDVVRLWLRTVRSDLKSVRNNIDGPEPSPESAAYHCQQAAEKLVKSVLVHQGIDPPRTHSIAALLARLPEGDDLAALLRPFIRFTAFASAFRYPTAFLDEPEGIPTLDELRGWLAELSAAEAVVRAALLGAAEGGTGA